MEVSSVCVFSKLGHNTCSCSCSCRLAVLVMYQIIYFTLSLFTENKCETHLQQMENWQCGNLSASQKLVYRHTSFVVVLSFLLQWKTLLQNMSLVLKMYKILLTFVTKIIFFSGGQPQTQSWGEDSTPSVAHRSSSWKFLFTSSGSRWNTVHDWKEQNYKYDDPVVSYFKV